MALQDPKNVTVLVTDDTVFHRISTEVNKSVYLTSDGSAKLTVSHRYGKRKQSYIRMDFNKIAVDPLVPTNSIPYTCSVSTSIDRSLVGWSIEELRVRVAAMAGLLTASVGADAVKILGGEN